MKLGLRSDLKWPKVGLEPKYHEPGTFGGFGKRKQTNRQTNTQDLCFISIDILGFFSLLISQKAESVHHFVFEWLTKHYSRSHFNVHFVIMRIMKLKNFRIWIYKVIDFDCLVILCIWTHGTLNYCFRVTIANKKIWTLVNNISRDLTLFLPVNFIT